MQQIFLPSNPSSRKKRGKNGDFRSFRMVFRLIPFGCTSFLWSFLSFHEISFACFVGLDSDFRKTFLWSRFLPYLSWLFSNVLNGTIVSKVDNFPLLYLFTTFPCFFFHGSHAPFATDFIIQEISPMRSGSADALIRAFCWCFGLYGGFSWGLFPSLYTIKRVLDRWRCNQT